MLLTLITSVLCFYNVLRWHVWDKMCKAPPLCEKDWKTAPTEHYDLKRAVGRDRKMKNIRFDGKMMNVRLH